MNIVDNSGKGLAALGRNEDRFMAHVAKGEMVVPPVISDKTKSLIKKEMQAVGLDPKEYEVGQGMSINPITGQAEFGFLKKLAKSVKKVVKKVAPIAAVIPGPWQPFAAVYQKGNAALKLAKGEGGLGDIMTVMAGGNQSVFGKDGALKSITSGDFKNIGGGFMDSLGSIGSVTDAAGKTSFNPIGYGKNVLKGMASDQQQGYFGAFGGGTGQFDVNTGQFVDYVGGPQGFNPLAPKRTVVQQGDSLSKIAADNNTTVEAIMEANPGITDPNVISAGQTLNMPGGTILNKTGNVIRGVTGIGSEQGPLEGKGPIEYLSAKLLPESVEQALGTGPGGDGLLSGSGGGGGGYGINPQMAALALLYGKAVKDAAKKTEGGLTDIRQSIRPDLNPAPVFAGFDLGVRKAAAFGGPIGYGRQYFNGGGIANKDITAILKDTTWTDQLSPATKAKITASQKEAFAKAFKKARAKGEGTKFMHIDGNNYIAVTKTDLKNKGYKTNELSAYIKNNGKPKGFFEGGLAAIGELDMRNGGESVGPGTGTSDDIPAMLSDGEFVMTAAANNGAGGFEFNKTKKGIELIASSQPDREQGVNVMNKLMDTFEKYNASGSMA